MSGLFKILLFTSPVLGLIFYYVVSQQSKLDVEMKKDDARFERDWNEFNNEFNSDFKNDKKRKYEQRAQQAEQEFQEMKKKEKEREENAEKFQSEFEKSIEQAEKEGINHETYRKNR